MKSLLLLLLLLEGMKRTKTLGAKLSKVVLGGRMAKVRIGDRLGRMVETKVLKGGWKGGAKDGLNSQTTNPGIIIG